MTPPYRVTVGGCLCPPLPDGSTRSRDHACVTQCTLWLDGPGGWWRVGQRSAHKADHILSVCDDWDDVLLMADELRLGPPLEAE